MIKEYQDKPYSGITRYKEKARKTAKELDRYRATRPGGHRHDLGIKKRNSLLSTEELGVAVWPNVSSTRVELRDSLREAASAYEGHVWCYFTVRLSLRSRTVAFKNSFIPYSLIHYL